MKKSFIMALALVLVLGIAIGGTVAWLTATSDTVTNTFTVGDINITLTETWNAKSDESKKDNDIWMAKLIPGSTYTKDPKVTVKANSEDCYLFVKFEETNNPSDYLTYTSTLTAENDWTQGQGTGKGKDGIPTNVWYRTVASSTTDTDFNLLKDNKVTVKDTIVKGTAGEGQVAMPTANNAPKLTYTAYAVQKDNLTAAQAWEKVAPTT